MAYAFLRIFIALGGSTVSFFLHYDIGLVWYLALGLPIPLVYWALSKVHGIGFLKALELEETAPCYRLRTFGPTEGSSPQRNRRLARVNGYRVPPGSA